MRFHASGYRSQRRNRLGADGSHRRRSARHRERARRVHAVMLQLRRVVGRREGPRGQAGHRAHDHPDRAGPQGFHGDAATRVRGTARGRRRGEPSGSDPRRAAHGAIQQARHAPPRHREQVRARGWILHALRRHVRRTRAAERCAEDHGVRARALGEPRTGNHPVEHHRPRAVRRAPAEPDRPGHPAAVRAAGSSAP